jgi:transposase-like protein
VYQFLKEAWACEEFEDVRTVMDQLAEDYQDKYPALTELIAEHAWETLGVYHVAPPANHRRLRTTNMLERVKYPLRRKKI